MVKFLLVAAILAGLWLMFRRTAPKPRLDESEARAILGVSTSADPDTIRAAHRRLVAAVHPDRGGSAELTQRINRARDVLLKPRD
ncbi:J domain-containing protein [Sphingomonas immobilis]|jgi:DnaJ-domain-containing protein 1|uniref:DnaJ domain-containing protein n=1 Tax=Sphingomonas immobilis TaxID=3063997 RepID=A0ABT8ZXB5_9SPHN|nr:DnaJ domain-containing protein [Sphingomonas sp. CA1-15]MDO7841431.1 DnaJ domain-containing protein [Sphingomonas sp. CA1-15]